MSEDPLVKAVGYWRDDNSRRLPRPQWLVRPDWHRAERAQIVSYLRSGSPWRGWLGFSFCRFHCGIDEQLMGCCDFTDGVWVWPEGLAHYVEAHAVSLPEEFVETMRAHEWRVPVEKSAVTPEDLAADFTVWYSYAARHRPWYALW